MKIQASIRQKLDHLTDNEKLSVVNYLLEELDKPDPEIDKAWAKESVRRQKDMRSGKIKTYSYDEVFGKYKK